MKTVKARVLVTEDDEIFARQMASFLEGEGYAAILAKDGKDALEVISNSQLDVGLVDLSMPGIDGMQLLKLAAEIVPDIPMVVVTGHGSVERAIQATKLGAFDFLEKPVNLDRVLLTIERALEKRSLEQRNKWMAAEIMGRYRMVGRSAAMQNVYRLIDLVAATDSTVLITGERGTGKELVAMAIHLQSHRASGPFVGVNCAAIPDDQIESELFGHRKGAFPGADENYKGKFLSANDGTLFIDEIGDLSLTAQAKLLQVLQSHEVEVIGENLPRKANARIIAATNKNLMDQIATGTFREDLFYRICVMDIQMPTLRERKEDIPELAEFFLKIFCEKHNRLINGITPAAMHTLMEYDWPGNIRQLRSVIENAVTFATTDKIENENIDLMLKGSLPGSEAVTSLQEARDDFERKYTLQTLMTHRWDLDESAKALGIERAQLQNLMNKYEIRKRG